MQIVNMTGYVLFWYLLEVKLAWGHKTRPWYLLGVTFKKSDEHPCHFDMGVPPGLFVEDQLNNLLVNEIMLDFRFCMLMHVTFWVTMTNLIVVSETAIVLVCMKINVPCFLD